MDRAFKFPPEPPIEPPRSPIPNITINGEPAPVSPVSSPRASTNIPEEEIRHVEIPPPTPAKAAKIEEEQDMDEELGETEEVDLS